ncbi:hypothetical protein [Amycolatopsis sp. CA-128772]|uniref:hypothetical protein n=1 Tax=Amycolatopsis sp. CA-128772 TaxID=2073159 RepID=UPI001304848C|nr:hypothetical protein [Amycolatopsis sp. CA-128772]
MLSARGMISIHTCTDADMAAVADLLAMGELSVDQALSPDLLVGEIDHRVVAALAPGSPVAADPFVATAEVRELLLLRANQLGWRRKREAPRWTRSWRAWYCRGALC